MGIMTGNQKQEPLHYGEVYGVWSHLAMAKGCIPKYQMLSNHTEDKDLRGFLGRMVEEVIRPEVQQMEVLLKENGITPPPSPAEKPAADAGKIPAGARFTDLEIATCISHDIAQNLAGVSQIIGFSLREDVAAMFAKHHAQLVRYGGMLLKMNKEKGWVVQPPLHMEVPELSRV